MKPIFDVQGHLITDNAIQVDKEGRIIGLPDAIIEQIADRVIQKLKADGSLDPDPRLWSPNPRNL